MKLGRKPILAAALVIVAAAALAGFELRPRHGLCTSRNIMFWRTGIRATQLRDNIYMLQAYGTDLINGNTVALKGDEGVLLVDPGHPELLAKERSALPGSGDSRIRFVIDSHAHPDHACANGEAFKQGAIIVGHANIKKFFDTDPSAPPRQTGDTPQLTYDDQMTLRFDGEQVHLIHPADAHTDADTITIFPRANVISTGDTFINGNWPYMKRGSIDGYIAAEKLILRLANDNTLIVPGHGPLSRRSDLLKSYERMVEVRRRIAALVAQGLTEEQVSARHPIDDLDAYVGDPSGRRELTSSAAVTRHVYRSLKATAGNQAPKS